MSQPRSDSRKFHCTHQCPGRCGRSVANHLYACGRCWRKLPAQLQQAIRTTVGQPVLSPARTRAFTAAYVPTGLGVAESAPTINNRRFNAITDRGAVTDLREVLQRAQSDYDFYLAVRNNPEEVAVVAAVVVVVAINLFWG